MYRRNLEQDRTARNVLTLPPDQPNKQSTAFRSTAAFQGEPLPAAKCVWLEYCASAADDLICGTQAVVCESVINVVSCHHTRMKILLLQTGYWGWDSLWLSSTSWGKYQYRKSSSTAMSYPYSLIFLAFFFYSSLTQYSSRACVQSPGWKIRSTLSVLWRIHTDACALPGKALQECLLPLC
jgi:hypothetical protein